MTASSDYDNLRYRPVTCPNAVADSIGKYLKAFGLVFGAFDFIVDQAGRWFFLECNSAGQWGWLAEECDLPNATAIADELTKECR